MTRTKKLAVAAVALVTVAGVGTGGYVYKHNADIKAHERAVREARIDRITRQYRADLRQWRSDAALWQQKQSAYEDCKAATSDAFEAADTLRGRIASGGSYDDYQTALTKFATKISSATRESGSNFNCLSVIQTLDEASGKVTKGTNIWLSWMNGDKYQYIDSPDELPGMDTHFRQARDKIGDAESALGEIEPAAKPVQPTRDHRYERPLPL